jgi:hypothetical protein
MARSKRVLGGLDWWKEVVQDVARVMDDRVEEGLVSIIHQGIKWGLVFGKESISDKFRYYRFNTIPVGSIRETVPRWGSIR